MWFRIIEIVLPSLGIQKVKNNYSNRHIKKKKLNALLGGHGWGQGAAL